MGPDPNRIHENNHFDRGEYIINDVEEEGMEIDEQSNNDGYLRLQINSDMDEFTPANDTDSSDDDEEEEENEFSFPVESAEEQTNNSNNNISPDSSIPNIRSSSGEIVTELYNTTTSNSIELTSEKSQQITQIMSKFSLPNSPPQWLNEISSEDIIDRIKNKNTSGEK